MNKAFIFDMDGVIIDTERVWAGIEKELHAKIFGKEIAEKIGPTIGMALPVIYDLAVSHGYTSSQKTYYEQSNLAAKSIYQKAAITSGFETVIHFLKKQECKIGLVSASPMAWINFALEKTSVKDNFDYIVSLHERDDLEHKPAPDGYVHAMHYLHTIPETTIILEDSNRGIQSAKASGAYTVGFRQNLQDGYEQTGADIYADTMDDVIDIVQKRFYEK